VCDGGGGPLGHPRIFINVDKPEICSCNYCGLPFVSRRLALNSMALIYPRKANKHHQEHLESLSSTSYPLVAQGDAAEAPESQRITDEALSQR
jgi:NADH dehydrogenase (ubiquinone) Fe-S protein 6